MTAQTPDPHDDLLRAALQAEAQGVTAGPELLAQIRRASAGRRPRRLVSWLLAAAAVAAIAGVGAVLLRDDDQRLDVSGGGPTTTTETAPTDTTSQPVGQHPTVVALVREDGWLVTVDLADGQQRELYFRGDPNDPGGEGGPSFINGVELSSDGRWVYFSTCCAESFLTSTTGTTSTTGGSTIVTGATSWPKRPIKSHASLNSDSALTLIINAKAFRRSDDCRRYT